MTKRTQEEIIHAQSKRIAGLRSNVKGLLKARERWEQMCNLQMDISMRQYEQRCKIEKEFEEWKAGNIPDYHIGPKAFDFIQSIINIYPLLMLVIGYLAAKLF